jgi:hypothetical protein
MKRARKSGWFEEYRCGCVSGNVVRRRDLLGYCPTHGEDRRGVFRAGGGITVQVERRKPEEQS